MKYNDTDQRMTGKNCQWPWYSVESNKRLLCCRASIADHTFTAQRLTKDFLLANYARHSSDMDLSSSSIMVFRIQRLLKCSHKSVLTKCRDEHSDSEPQAQRLFCLPASMKMHFAHEPGPHPQRGWSRLGSENAAKLYAALHTPDRSVDVVDSRVSAVTCITNLGRWLTQRRNIST